MWNGTLKAKAARALAATRHRVKLREFLTGEAGTLVVFSLMLAVLMLMMGGIAVDVMRYESRRTSLQNTLDRSTLAAASLTQKRDPRAVVDDYFLKAGLLDYLTTVTVTEGLNYRQVTATAAADTQPMFLGMMGINDFDAPGLSQAEQRVNNVEVMMVLDVSGSMKNNNRMTNLKSAATEFVETVLSNDPENKISIGMVPFNGQVNLGPTFRAQFNTIYPSGTANVDCIDLPANAYNSLTISQYAHAATVAPTALSLTADADTYDSYSLQSPNPDNKWCPPQPGNIIRLPTQNIATLQSQINGLTPIGATSINAGLKWGLGLLDPGSRPIFTSLIGGGAMSNTLAGRPYDYSDKEAMKVIVLMTDGEHFREERVHDSKKSGNSPIYLNAADGRYSIFHSSRVNTSTNTTICNSRPFYVPHLNTWHSRAWNGSNPSGSACYVATATTTATIQPWTKVWKDKNMQYVTCYWFAVPLGYSSCNSTSTAYNDLLATFRSTTSTSDMDDQLQEICTLAKAQKVIIYGIAFEASENGQTQIRQCSTGGETGSHYFDAQGLQISTAFNAIANNISQLRLTQ